jgi:hypothetical protein
MELTFDSRGQMTSTAEGLVFWREIMNGFIDACSLLSVGLRSEGMKLLGLSLMVSSFFTAVSFALHRFRLIECKTAL